MDPVVPGLDFDRRIRDVEVAVRSSSLLCISAVGYVDAVSPRRDIHIGFGKTRTVIGLDAVLCCRDPEGSACDLDVILSDDTVTRRRSYGKASAAVECDVIFRKNRSVYIAVVDGCECAAVCEGVVCALSCSHEYLVR